MKTSIYFKWSTRMMMQTIILLLFFLGFAAFCGYHAMNAVCCYRYLIAVGILLVAILAALVNMPRKIIIDKYDKKLVICLIGYKITIPFNQIESVQPLAENERLTIQIFGTTGMFGYNGLYRTNSKETVLGFVSDASCMHIIRRKGKRPVVISIPNLSDILMN